MVKRNAQSPKGFKYTRYNRPGNKQGVLLDDADLMPCTVKLLQLTAHFSFVAISVYRNLSPSYPISLSLYIYKYLSLYVESDSLLTASGRAISPTILVKSEILPSLRQCCIYNIVFCKPSAFLAILLKCFVQFLERLKGKCTLYSPNYLSIYKYIHL